MSHTESGARCFMGTYRPDVRGKVNNIFILLYHQLTFIFVHIQILAIRREDELLWEKRAPLSPNHVKELVLSGVKVLVQPSSRRIYPVEVNICQLI